MSSPDALPPLFDEFPAISTEEWDAKIRDDLGRRKYDDVLQWDSIEGVSLPGFLRRDDLGDLPHVETDDGTPPLAKGDDVPANTWQIRQDITHPDPSTVRRLADRVLDRGITAVSLGRPPSTTIGRSFAQNATLDFLTSVIENIALDEVSLHFDGGMLAPILFGAVQEIVSSRGNDPALTGSVAYDPIAALARGGIANRDAAFDLAGDLIDDTPAEVRSLCVDLRPYHDAGASAVQELTFGLGAMTEVLSTLLEQGYSLADVLPRLEIVTSVSTSYFVEIGKVRALRLLVPQVVRAYANETGDDYEIEQTDLSVHAETSRRTETVFDPYVNMLRATTEAMAAVIGGCDSLSVRPFDSSLRPPDVFGTRIARNVQLILGEEAHLEVVSDPAAGAYYVEAATDRLAQRAWTSFQSLESAGGLLDELRAGHVHEQIADVRAKRRHEVDDRERILVGTNHYPNLNERRLDDLQSNPNGEPGASDDGVGVSGLDDIRAGLQNGRSALSLAHRRKEEDVEIEVLPRVRVSEGIEKLRLRTERHADETGHLPTVLLAPLGPAKARSARATFARNVFGVAGFDVVEPLRFETPQEVADAAAENDADIVVLCSSDDEYPSLTPALHQELQNVAPSPLLVVAGNPNQIDADLHTDDFIHRGISLGKKMESFQVRLGLDGTSG